MCASTRPWPTAQLADVASQNVATLDDHLQLAQANEDTGNSTHFDVLRILAQREEAVAGPAGTRPAFRARDLAQAMGLSQDARSLDGSLPSAQGRPGPGCSVAYLFVQLHIVDSFRTPDDHHRRVIHCEG